MPLLQSMKRLRAAASTASVYTLVAGAIFAALSLLASAPAQADGAQGKSRIGFYGSHGYEMAAPVSRGHRPSSKYSASDDDNGPEVAPKRRRSQPTRLVDSDDETPRKSRAKRTRSARVNSDDDDSKSYSSKPKVSGGHVSWVASGGCLPGSLKSVIAEVADYGRVVVSSTHRSGGHNRAVGGASKSYHLSCQAADFRVHGNVGAAASFLRNHGSVGGFHHYGGGLFHIDTGPKRSW